MMLVRGVPDGFALIGRMTASMVGPDWFIHLGRMTLVLGVLPSMRAEGDDDPRNSEAPSFQVDS